MKRTRIVPHRRRREAKTDYRARLKLLKSSRPRFIVRKSSNSITCQVASYGTAGDRIIVSVNSMHVKKSGWKGHTGNLPAAYLTGYLCGLNAKKSGISEAVLDTGLYKSTKGSRLYAALKGVLDAGINIPHSVDVLPADDRISGKHIAVYAEKLKKENPEKYGKIFSDYIKNKLPPESLPAHFSSVKQKLFHVKGLLAK